MVSECKAGEVYIVDFDKVLPRLGDLAGRIHVGVISSRFLNVGRNIVNVVPLVFERPSGKDFHVVPFKKPYYWAPGAGLVWGRCDHAVTLDISSLEHVHDASVTGRNNNPVPQLKAADLLWLRIGVGVMLSGFGLLNSAYRRKYRDHIRDASRSDAASPVGADHRAKE